MMQRKQAVKKLAVLSLLLCLALLLTGCFPQQNTPPAEETFHSDETPTPTPVLTLPPLQVNTGEEQLLSSQSSYEALEDLETALPIGEIIPQQKMAVYYSCTGKGKIQIIIKNYTSITDQCASPQPHRNIHDINQSFAPGEHRLVEVVITGTIEWNIVITAVK